MTGGAEYYWRPIESLLGRDRCVGFMFMGRLTNIFGRWIDRDIFGIPMNVFLQYIVPVLSVPFLMLFKYGKPRAYLKDLFAWHTKPRIYCGMEPDSQLNSEYLTEEEVNANDLEGVGSWKSNDARTRSNRSRGSRAWL